MTCPALFPILSVSAAAAARAVIRRLLAAGLLLGLAGCAGVPRDEEALGRSLTGPVDLPFVLDRQRIVVEATINGEASHGFLFDTGLTDTHLITPAVATALRLPWRPVDTAYDAAGRPFRIGQAALDSLTLGPLRLADEPVAVLDLPAAALQRSDGGVLAGILGDRLVQDFPVTLDFDRGSLRLGGEVPAPDAETLVLPLGWRGNLLVTQVRVGDRDLRLLVDTGDFGSITLFDEHRGLPGLLVPEGPGTAIPVLGAAGPYALQMAVMPRLRLGGREVGPLSAALSPRGEGMPAFLDGRLGLGLLSRYRVVLDTRRQRLLLFPREFRLAQTR
ncbi:aspartyl protease family protein [Oleisolibacter albus]|uniref:aspartyl protease family protein n=1 Tax=Oleisolibacter albus TaxID=2171757 RepID=UPI000DF1C9DF|nr:aspartyl protease family protein [Oleisolibacter albus]